MRNLEIVDKQYHSNGNCAPFVVAIVDDPEHNDTKLVIMFADEEYTAVLSLDTLIESEDITPEENGFAANTYEAALRKHLWSIEEDYDYEPSDSFYEDEDEEY